MLRCGDRVVAGVSGGADSVCLLFILLALQQKLGLSLAAVHVNHQIRAEAGEDARYVEKLCAEWGIPFFLAKKDVRSEAERLKCSEEEAGRKVRYEAFRQAAETFHADKIAVAHNSNDRSETMLFHLFRGSGIKGLGSIRPVRDDIIRPILCLERWEVEEYLRQKDVFYCMDATNEGDDYTRNRIRHNILPYAEKEIAPGCVSHIARACEMLAETEDYLEEQTAAAIHKCVAYEQGGADKSCTIIVSELLKCHPFLQKRILHTLVKDLSPQAKDISYVHIKELQMLFTGEGNRMVCLPFRITGRREYDKVILERNADTAQAGQKIEDGMHFPYKICYAIFENSVEKNKEVPQNEYTKWFDCDKIEQSLEIRTRQTGDYLTLADKEGRLIHQSLKDFFINQKIPAGIRDSIPVLAQGSHVVWLVGYRISEYYKIDENTKRILQVQLIKNIESEGIGTV